MSKAATIKTALSDFTADLYDKIVGSQGSNLQNVVLSPLSIYTAVIMTMAGTDGQTKQEISHALHLQTISSHGDPHEAFAQELVKYFQPSEAVELALANRLFLLKDVAIVDAFRQILRNSYKADLEVLTSVRDLEASRTHINKWIAEQTRDKIDEVITRGTLNHNSTLVIVNALYFRGFWHDEFNKANTHSENFYCLDGSTMKVQMMYKESTFPLINLPDVDAHAVKLPFKGTDWEMLIVLPHQHNNLPSLVKHLQKPGKLHAILASNFEDTKIQLHLPRFKLETKEPLDIKAALMRCGVKSLFGSSADLSKMCSELRLFVDSALHKAIIEVDEEGATAAAATAMIAACMSLVRMPVIRVDHPFFVALICDKTVPVFVGHVAKPESLEGA